MCCHTCIVCFHMCTTVGCMLLIVDPLILIFVDITLHLLHCVCVFFHDVVYFPMMLCTFP